MNDSTEYNLSCCNTSGNETRPSVKTTFPVVFSTYLVSACFALTAVLGFIGNSVTLSAFAVERKLLRKNFNLLILNLTVADFCVAVLDIPFQVVYNLTGRWPFGIVECALMIFCDFSMTFVSIFTLVAISIDRFWAACYAQSYKIHNTRKRTLICIALIWCFLLVTWLPVFIIDRIRVGNRQPNFCYFSTQGNRSYFTYVVIAGYHLPSCLMVFCNVRIYLAVRQARSRIAPSLREPLDRTPTRIELQPRMTDERSDDRSTEFTNAMSANREIDLATISGAVPSAAPATIRKTEARSGDREARIFRSLSYIVTAYLLLWTPLHILSDVDLYDSSLLSDDSINFVSVFCYLNSAVNPVLYAASCDVTKNAMLRVLRCKRT